MGCPNFKIVWLASDYNPADDFTKKKRECRLGLEEYLIGGRWKLKYDPEWVISTKRAGKQALKEIRAERLAEDAEN